LLVNRITRHIKVIISFCYEAFSANVIFHNFAGQNQKTKNFIILCQDTVNGQP
jgi:hypothetical protein